MNMTRCSQKIFQIKSRSVSTAICRTVWIYFIFIRHSKHVQYVNEENEVASYG